MITKSPGAMRFDRVYGKNSLRTVTTQFPVSD